MLVEFDVIMRVKESDNDILILQLMSQMIGCEKTNTGMLTF